MNNHLSTVFITFNCRRAARTRAPYTHERGDARRTTPRLAYHRRGEVRRGEVRLASPRVCVNAPLRWVVLDALLNMTGWLTNSTAYAPILNLGRRSPSSIFQRN